MAINRTKFLIIPLIVTLLMSCALSPTADSLPQITAFKSDGCSLFPDGTINNNKLWYECCFEHDLVYWRGGIKEEKQIADSKLRDCITEKTGNTILAKTMYIGVIIGGSAYFPTWYRWGYGWPYGRGYKSLTKPEKQQISERLNEYCQQNQTSIICNN